MSITDFISKLGQNIKFIAFNAHAGFAFTFVSFFPSLKVMAALLVLAAVKEFWFDIKYETGQTIKDGLLDFAGYFTGVALFLASLAL